MSDQVKDNGGDKPSVDCCGTCCFWHQNGLEHAATKSGVCRRYPPMAYPIMVKGNVGFVNVYPTVQASEWCGEWEPI